MDGHCGLSGLQEEVETSPDSREGSGEGGGNGKGVREGEGDVSCFM